MSEAIDDTRQRSGNHILKRKESIHSVQHELQSAFRKKIENKLSGKLSKSSAFLLFKYSMCLSTKVKKK